MSNQVIVNFTAPSSRCPVCLFLRGATPWCILNVLHGNNYTPRGGSYLFFQIVSSRSWKRVRTPWDILHSLIGKFWEFNFTDSPCKKRQARRQKKRKIITRAIKHKSLIKFIHYKKAVSVFVLISFGTWFTVRSIVGFVNWIKR